jgi:hypothetical protein
VIPSILKFPRCGNRFVSDFQIESNVSLCGNTDGDDVGSDIFVANCIENYADKVCGAQSIYKFLLCSCFFLLVLRFGVFANGCFTAESYEGGDTWMSSSGNYKELLAPACVQGWGYLRRSRKILRSMYTFQESTEEWKARDLTFPLSGILLT